MQDMTVTSGAVAAMWFVFIFFFETLPLMLSGGDKALVLGAARSATPR